MRTGGQNGWWFPGKEIRGSSQGKEGRNGFRTTLYQEQEEFRQEVRSWLEANVPDDMKEPYDSRDFSKEQYLVWRETHKKLAEKGWLFPTFPKEYGGGGLTGDHETIISEEFQNSGSPTTSPTSSYSRPFWSGAPRSRSRSSWFLCSSPRLTHGRSSRSPAPAQTWPTTRAPRYATATTGC